MVERRAPDSLRWLGVLIVLALVFAIGGGATLYVEARHKRDAVAEALAGGRVADGHQAMLRYGCGSCHTIPGIEGAAGAVGPPLSGIATRTTIAGALPNDPETMKRWLVHPQRLRPGTAMPEQGVSERDARAMTAYLYTLR